MRTCNTQQDAHKFKKASGGHKTLNNDANLCNSSCRLNNQLPMSTMKCPKKWQKKTKWKSATIPSEIAVHLVFVNALTP